MTDLLPYEASENVHFLHGYIHDDTTFAAWNMQYVLSVIKLGAMPVVVFILRFLL